jgi:DNA-binding PadR family transcriptional regulator
MEYFILALIDRAGLNSLYLFQKFAGLQPGGIRPALQRLEDLRLVQRAESARRQKRNISITSEGKDVLKRGWQSCLVDSSDAESALRAICVALLMGQPDEARYFAKSVRTHRLNVGRDKELEAERLHKAQDDPLSLYAWVRALNEARRRVAESEAFAELVQHLEGKKDANGTPDQ